jgi:hypothetical protein
MDPFFIVYLTGFAISWRYVVGAFLHEFTYGDPDGADFCFALFMGSLVTLFWPILAIGRGIFVTWVKYGSDRTAVLGNFFPEPKEIETAKQKRQRLDREKAEQVRLQRAQINDRERELELPLTKWN